jgi:hypothetical protein
MSEETQNPSPAAQPQAQVPAIQLDSSNLRTEFANIARITVSPNEVYVDFGVNPNFFGQQLDEVAKLNTRVIMTPDAAKRICIGLSQFLGAYEQRFGVIELDVTKRLRS